MPFPTSPVLCYKGNGLYATVGITDYVGSSDVIHIPDGFITDLASVPRIFWALLPPTGTYERAALVHDFGCVSLAEGTCLLSSRDVDGLFRRIAREGGTGLVARWLLWAGVRWGALFNPVRRAQWWKDSPAVVAITVVAFVATAIAITGLDYVVHALIGWL